MFALTQITELPKIKQQLILNYTPLFLFLKTFFFQIKAFSKKRVFQTKFWVPGHVIANLEAEIQQKWAKIRKKANSMVVSEVRAIVFD